MQSLIDFARTASPLGVIAILAIIIYQLVSTRLFRAQNTSKVDSANDNAVISLATLNRKLDTIAGNHLHDLPSMRIDVSSIKESVGIIQKEQIKQGNRLTRVETILKVNEEN